MSFRICKQCGVGFMQTNNDKFCLSKITETPSGIEVNVGTFVPVKVEICNQCGHVDLIYSPPQK